MFKWYLWGTSFSGYVITHFLLFNCYDLQTHRIFQNSNNVQTSALLGSDRGVDISTLFLQHTDCLQLNKVFTDYYYFYF